MLTYWITFGFTHAFESALMSVLFFIPGFKVFRLLFLIYVLHPKLNGYSHIYKFILEPILSKYEVQIDKLVRKAERTINDVAHKGAQMAVNKAFEEQEKEKEE
jgi:hypothetical protein